jgi:hypothetical protein
MSRTAWRGILLGAALAGLAGGCRHSGDPPPPPDARRPVIKSEQELAAQRDELIQAGKVTPTSAPALLAAESSSPRIMLPPPIAPTPGAIEAEILLVNDSVLTIPEALYTLWERLAEARKTYTREGFVEQAQRMLRARVQQEVGALLIYKEAMAKLNDPQRDKVKEALDKEVKEQISRDFGGSSARFQRHLAEHGLTLEQFRTLLEREMVARQYTREKLLPQITVRRDELLAHYRRTVEQRSSAETRALWMIEVPFEAFGPPGKPWAQVSAAERAQARAEAVRQIRQAHAALADQPFEEVSRRYSKGVQAAQGGSWGEIARPLQPPYDQVSAKVFDLAEGEYSEPFETDRGWYIVRCGQITPAKRVAFADVQEDLRRELIERKFEKLSAEYMIRLAEGATVASLDAFIKAGVRRAFEQTANATPNQ